MTYWLIREEIISAFDQARIYGMAPSADAVAKFMAEQDAITASDKPRSFTQAGDVAEIRVEGVLTPRPSLYAMLFGGGNTSYPDIQAAIALAQNEPTVKRVVFDVRSPGGTVDGLFDTLASIQSMTKPRAVRGTQAASAAYAIAATVGRIQAKNTAAEFGSIGVAATLVHIPEIIDIASTQAPKKRPDPSTEEGKAIVREYLDQIHALFVDAIASGRGTKPDTVNAQFGQGAVLLASEAKRRGMIDGVMTQRPRLVGAGAEAMAADYDALFADPKEEPKATIVDMKSPSPIASKPTAAVAAKQGTKPMTKEEMKAQHRDVYDAIFNDGAEAGTKKERDRVNAHLTLGSQSGDMKTAVEAIEKGDELNQTYTARYLAAGMNKRDRESSQADSDAAGAVVAGATQGGTSSAEAGAKDLGDMVADRLEAQRGVKPAA